MNDKIFRKKSIDRMSSPEQLNDYIRVTNYSVWTVFAAVSDNGRTVCYVKEENIDPVKESTNVYCMYGGTGAIKWGDDHPDRNIGITGADPENNKSVM